MLVAPVIHPHRDHHRHQARRGPHQLLRQKRIRRPKPLPRHHCRRRKHHHQPHKHQQHGHRKQPAIDTNPLRHGKFISPRSHEVSEKNCRLFILDCCLSWFGATHLSQFCHPERSKCFANAKHLRSRRIPCTTAPPPAS